MADSSTSKVDPYGFERDDNFDFCTYEDYMSKYLSVLARRASKWNQFISGQTTSLAKSGKLKRYCRKGIPSEHRPMVWMYTSGAKDAMEENGNLYKKLLQSPRSDLLTDIIKTDVPRTFPENIYFQNTPTDPLGKRGPLFNILYALAVKNKEVGYCQGMNFVVGMLLLIVKEEEKVFWLMDTLMNNILPNYYSPTMAGIRADQQVLSELVKKKLPDVHRHMDSQGVTLEMVTTKWFICCYADVLPVETVLRVWDALFYEGSKVLFRVGVTLISLHRPLILAARTFPDIVAAFKQITADKMSLNCHDFMQNVFKVPGSFPQSEIMKLRQTCMKNVEEGN